MPEPSLLQRLKERKLVQWGIAYLAGAFVVFQLLDALAEPLKLSTTVQRAILVIVGVGFFIMLVLAWYHGEKGRQWASGPELLIIALLLLISGGVLSVLKPGEETGQISQVIAPIRDADDRPSIAVLPCESMSPDPEDKYLADGIHEEILVRLQQISALYSIGRTSVLRYGENPPPVTEIAAALQVRSVGECSIRKQEDRIRVTFQLLDGSTGGQRWAETYDTTLTAENLFDIQSDIAQEIAQSMRAVLSPEERARIETTPTLSMEAYNAYLLGRYRWNQRDPETLPMAIEHFEDATRLDSTFALGFVGLADSYMVAPNYGEFISVQEAREKGLAAAQRALEINDLLGEAHASLAAVKLWLEWDWEGAARGFQRAIELSPRYAMAHQWYGLLLMYQHRFTEAEERLRFALSLDPLYPIIHYNVGDLMWMAGHAEEAAEHLESTLELFPDFSPVRVALARVYIQLGRYSDAIGLIPGDGYSVFAHLALGREAEARALADRLADEGTLQQRLRARAGLNDFEAAFMLLDQALRERRAWVLYEPNVYPIYQNLHSDLRWADYLRRIGVEDPD